MKKKSLLLVCGVLVAILTGGCAAAQNPVNVTVSGVKTEAALSGNQYDGTVKADSSAQIAPSISGKVAQVNVKEGQSVTKGTVLFTMDNTDIQLQVNQSKASLNAAQVGLQNATASANSGASVIPAQTAYDDAKANLDRMTALYNQGAISQVDYENAKSKVETAQAQLTSAQLAQKSACSNAAAQVQTAEAALAAAQQKLSDCVITSPISGQVSQLTIDNGSIVSPQAPAMTIIDNNSLKVGIEVLERDIDKIKVGMPATVEVPSIDASSPATVSEISPAADSKTGMFQVYVQLNGDNSQILAGMNANVTLDSGDKDQSMALYVPNKSVHSDKTGSYVFTLNGSQLKKQPVTVGEQKNEYTQIKDGLGKDDHVVVQGSGQLSDGMEVTVVKTN